MARNRVNYSGMTANEPVAEEPIKQETFDKMVREKGAPVRVRTGPGTDHPQANGAHLGKGIHRVIDHASGAGSKSGWGKLADGRGWVALDFVDFVESK